ncbi:MAG: hypothetical protein IKB01_05755 [Lachnospiraceae bacterium]|nr:hypothetical protein [Lachnospiraceae bacterium]
MKDYETIGFGTQEECFSFFKKQKESDIWKRCFISEMSVKPLPNCPIMVSQIMSDLDITGIDNSSVIDAMEDKRLALTLPLEKLTTRPIRYTAFKTLCERAGLSGSALSCYSEKPRQKEMEPENKAAVLNYGLECFNGSKALVLIRDEKVSAVLSGDGKDYSPLPVYDLAKALETGLTDTFHNVKFVNSHVNHELACITFTITDEDVKDLMLATLNKCGHEEDSVIINITLITSDVGASGANLFPEIICEGKAIAVGDEIVLPHKHGHNIDDFKLNVGKVYSCLQDGCEKMEALNKIVLKNPLGCCKAVAFKLGLPKNEAIEAAEFFDAVRPPVTTALDLYWNMWDIIPLYEKSCKEADKEFGLVKKMNLKENISRIMNMDIKRFDEPFEWL